MRTIASIAPAAAAAAAVAFGIGMLGGAWIAGSRPTAEGPIRDACWQWGSATMGFTSLDMPQAVPGGNGTYGEHRYGKLYRDYLIVTKPEDRSFGVQVIPAGRLMELHFEPYDH